MTADDRVPTIGVEEEFLLVDNVTGRTVARAAEVLAEAIVMPLAASDAALHRELRSTQLEAASGRCTTLSELRDQLSHARRQLSRAAHEVSAELVSTGTPVLLGDPGAGNEPAGARYEQIDAIYAQVVADYQACGCHVHVSVPDRELAVAVLNRLRPWLPSLLALSGNSPIHDGRDTGYESWRMVQQARFPGSGIPPWFPNAAAYDAELARLVACGVLVDDRMTFWLARPSPHLPTIEFRVADAAATVEEAVLQAALARAMVQTAIGEIDERRRCPEISDQIAAAAVWSAARYGLHGAAVHPGQACRVPAIALVRELFAWVTPALRRSGELATVRSALAALVRNGTGAERQRRAAQRGPREVVRMLVAQTVGRQE